MPVRTEQVELGSRVSYEDQANPRRTGTVLETGVGSAHDQFVVKWDEDEVTTISDLRQHGWYLVAVMPGNPFDGADILSSYTRTDAIRDGVLVPVTDLVPDEPDFARQAGFVVPVALTTAVANLVIPTEREAQEELQDLKGRLWDVLSMARLHARRTAAAETRFPCIFALAGSDRARWTTRKARKTIMLKAVIGPGDDGEPVVTIMLEGED